MRDLIEKALAVSAPRAASARQLLETLRDLSGKQPVKREAVRAALGKREGRAISEATFAKRLERLNADLAAASVRLRIVSEGGVLAARDEAASIEARLEERSRRETLREGVGKQPPRAMPEKLWVLFSYAWQPIKSQQAIQLDLFERLQHLLNQKPPEFQHLPQIEMWRDADRLERSYGAAAQIKDICSRAFLVLAMMSGKYPTSQGCMDEFDAFVDDKGENRSGKMAIVVAVNCQRGEVARRFSDGLRLWVPDEGRTLVDSSRRSEASKHAFAKSVAVEIWKAAERYLGQTPRSETLTVDPIEQALERHGAKLKLADLVDPRAERGRTADEAAPKGDGANILDHLERWAINRDGARMTALLGDFGMGKTVTCQMLTQRLLAARKTNPRAPLPIYLDLREIKDARAAGAADLETLMRDMLAHVGEAPLDARAVIKYAREHDALIVFDGLDEVTNKLDKAQAETLYRALLRIVPEEDWDEDRAARLARLAPLSFPTKRSNPRPPSPRKGPLLLVSCRTHYFPDLAAQRAFLIDKDRAGLDATADVDVWFMLPFNEQQIKNCLTQTLGEIDAARALELIETTYNLKETTSRPILLRFFSETFRELEERKLKGETIDIGKLYEAFVDQTFARDGIKHVIPPLQKKRLLAELALHLHVEGLNAIDNAKLDVWLAESIDGDPALRKLKWAAEGDAVSRFELFLQDLRSASLLVRPGETEFRFGHTSVREFFLAEALHRHAREGKLDALGSAEVTSETLDFLLARQRHAVTSAEAERWREGMRRLIEPGRGLDLRKFAYEVTRRARDISWPSKADFSDLDLTGARFAAPGQGPRDALPLPPSAIWRGARLHQASFEGLRLAGQDFSGADATSSFWVECDFGGAMTEGMDLSGAELRVCRGAEALGAKMDLVLQVGGGDGRAAAPHRDVCVLARAPSNNLQVQSLQFDGRPCLAVRTARWQVQIVNADSGQMLGGYTLEGHDLGFHVFDHDGRPAMAWAGADANLFIGDAISGRQLRRIETQAARVYAPSAVVMDGRLQLATASQKGLQLWDVLTGACTAQFDWELPRFDFQLVGCDDDADILILRRPQLECRHLKTGRQVWAREFSGLDHYMSVDVFDDLGTAKISVYSPHAKTVLILDRYSGETLEQIDFGSDIFSITTTKLGDEVVLAAAGLAGIEIWSPHPWRRRAQLRDGYVGAVATVNVAGRPSFAAAGQTGLRLIDAGTGDVSRRLASRETPADVVPVRWRDRETALILADGAVNRCDLRTGETLPVRSMPRTNAFEVALSSCRDGGPIALGRMGSDTVQLFKLEGTDATAPWPVHAGVKALVRFDWEGRALLAVLDMDDNVSGWDLARPHRVWRYASKSLTFDSLETLDLNGRTLLAVHAGSDASVHLLDPASGRRVRVLKVSIPKNASELSLAVIRVGDDALVAVGEPWRGYRLHDPETGADLGPLDLGLGQVRFRNGVEPGSLICWYDLITTIDAVSVEALVKKQGVVRMRQFAPSLDYAGSFVETVRDAATHELLDATVGPNAWRDFTAFARGPDDRQTRRALEDIGKIATSLP